MLDRVSTEVVRQVCPPPPLSPATLQAGGFLNALLHVHVHGIRLDMGVLFQSFQVNR